MSKIRIVNWLLTRRCNLKCDYCAIVKNYKDKPPIYPEMSHYIKNEMSTDFVLYSLKRIKLHNRDAFHIFYGGEPLLRKDLADIINFCNDEDIHYTIISNNTEEIQPLILKLINDVHGDIKGFTASVDPIFYSTSSDDDVGDRIRKSLQGLENLKRMKKYCKDVVAEITVMKHNQQHIHELVTYLSREGISSDITFIDIAKNPYYDFSNITDESMLVEPSKIISDQFHSLLENDDVDIHMKETLLPAILNTLPSNMDCKIDEGLHNISIDADGSIRLCLRIRGVLTPKFINMQTLFNERYEIPPAVLSILSVDKRNYCKLCNHTCQLMSKIIDDDNLGLRELVHLDRR